MKRLVLSLSAVAVAGLLAGVPPALADDDDDDDDGAVFEVTVTNLTRGQSFTPILVATHEPSVRLFEVGEAASEELATLAEGGDIGPLEQSLLDTGKVSDTANSGGLLPDGLLEPGESVTITVTADGAARQVSLAAMLIPTNDTFMAFRNLALPRGRSAIVGRSPGYDAGSEPNDELCENIPGPVCGGEGASPDAGGEGFVHIQAGIHGIGDLMAAERDWRNPVAEVTIRRVSR